MRYKFVATVEIEAPDVDGAVGKMSEWFGGWGKGGSTDGIMEGSECNIGENGRQVASMFEIKEDPASPVTLMTRALQARYEHLVETTEENSGSLVVSDPEWEILCQGHHPLHIDIMTRYGHIRLLPKGKLQ